MMRKWWRIIKNYKLNENNIRISYTNGSRTEEEQATGVAIVEKEEFYFSIDRRYSIFTAESIDIAKAIQKNENINKDIRSYS